MHNYLHTKTFPDYTCYNLRGWQLNVFSGILRSDENYLSDTGTVLSLCTLWLYEALKPKPAMSV